jgi:hypothetical protein
MPANAVLPSISFFMWCLTYVRRSVRRPTFPLSLLSRRLALRGGSRQRSLAVAGGGRCDRRSESDLNDVIINSRNCVESGKSTAAERQMTSVQVAREAASGAPRRRA